mgnify:CR=1 FL=1
MSHIKKYFFLLTVFASVFLLCQFDAFSDDEKKRKAKESSASKSDDFAEAMKAIEKVRKELKDGAHVDEGEGTEITPLYAAVSGGNKYIVELLINEFTF